MVAEGGRRGALVPLGAGLSDVRSDEKVDELVMERERVVGLIIVVEERVRSARLVRRGSDIVLV